VGNYVTLNVINGTLNGSSVEVWITYNNGGKFSFNALDNCVVQLDLETIANIKIQGPGGTGTYETDAIYPIETGQSYVFYWNSSLMPILPIMFIIGLIGLLFCFVGPIYLIMKIRERDMDGVKIGIIICAFAFAFVVAWVWSGA